MGIGMSQPESTKYQPPTSYNMYCIECRSDIDHEYNCKCDYQEDLRNGTSEELQWSNT